MLVDSIRDRLIKVFTPPQAELLAEVVVKTHDTLATRSDMHELRVAMRELADQQKLTSAEVQALGEQQQLTSRAVRELAEQQRLTSAEVRELAEQQRLTSAEVRELAEQQKGMDVELGELKSTVSELTSAVGELKSSVGELRSTVGELSSTVGELAASVRTLDIRTNKTAGWALEWLVGRHLPAYVGRAIKRCRVVGPMDVIDSLETRPAMRELTDEELEDLRRVDLIATGSIDGEKIYLVGEVSYTVHNDDVLRAARRAAVLRKVGERSQPFVACDVIAPVSAELAIREGVWVIREGRLLTPAA